MQILTPDQVRIERTCLAKSKGYEYRIISPDREGNAVLIFSNISECPYNLHPIFENEGLEEKSVTSEIKKFSPNGSSMENLTYQYLKRGIGTVLLDKIIQDSVERNAVVLYVLTYLTLMADFLRKKGFIEKAPFYYKLLPR